MRRVARILAWALAAAGLARLAAALLAAPGRALEAASPPPAARRLGDALVERGLVDREALAWALARQRETGERLGRVLLTAGLVRRQDLHRTLAALWGVPFADLLRDPPPAPLVREVPLEEMIAGRWVPVARRGRVVEVASAERPGPALEAAVRKATGAGEVRVRATTDWDVDSVLRAAFRRELAREAAASVMDRDPMESARLGLVRRQRIAVALAGTLLAAALVLAPSRTLVAVLIAANAWFLAGIAFKLTAAVAGRWRVVRARGRVRGDPRIPDRDLPVVTVLVPAFHEANVVAGLVRHLGTLDYPPEKLEVLLLMEEEDAETIAAARAARPPERVRFVIVPPGEPQTKPRACNVGLRFATGELLVIYDAEDRPEPGQLREAVAAFRRGGPELVCVQARLNYLNARANALTRMFTLEYSAWFDDMLPGLDALGLPIPLGGTSNHFRTEALRRLGGWDAYNVTEDADLGLRAAAEGLRVGIIASTTYEEACSRLRPWIRQRTRWIKGYMQTTIVHARRPAAFVRRGGLRGLAGMLLLVAGTPLTFLAAPVLWALSIAWLAAGRDLGPLPGWAEWVTLLNLVAGNGALVAMYALAVARRRLWWLLPWALAAPLYWVLHSVAAWRALWQLVRCPFRWEKTPHGLTVAAEHGVPAEAASPA